MIHPQRKLSTVVLYMWLGGQAIRMVKDSGILSSQSSLTLPEFIELCFQCQALWKYHCLLNVYDYRKCSSGWFVKNFVLMHKSIRAQLGNLSCSLSLSHDLRMKLPWILLYSMWMTWYWQQTAWKEWRKCFRVDNVKSEIWPANVENVKRLERLEMWMDWVNVRCCMLCL